MKITGLRTTVKKINGDSLTPVLIFKRLQGTHKFLLESASLHDGVGRYSIIGANPRKSYVGNGEEIVETVLETGQTYTHQGELFVLLKRLMPRVINDSGLPFFGGAVGYIGSGATQIQSISDDELQLPDAHFNIYDTVVVFDHLLDEVTIVHTNIDAEEKVPDLEQIANSLLHGNTTVEEGYQLSSLASDLSAEAFATLVEEAQQALAEKDLTQLVISRRLQANFTGSTFDLYRTLRKREASPYMYYIECGQYVIIGASPACLVKVTGDKVQANPVAGTIERGANAAEDVKQEQVLLRNSNEVKRHNVLVEDYKTDLAKVTIKDSVVVTDYLRAVRFPSVIHIVSQLEGALLPMLHGLDALSASLPAGAVTGIPKKQALESIKQLEKKNRSFYGGAVGYIGFNGNLDFALTIRSMLLKDDKAYTQVGATVSADSIVDQQFDNTERKIASLASLSEVGEA